MNASVLIVEDELLVAMDMEAMIEDLGYRSIGIASDLPSALVLAGQRPDIALVDLNLRDGATGLEIGKRLGEIGVTVIFVTANPRMLGSGVPGTLGVMTKPLDDERIGETLSYALCRMRGESVSPPSTLSTFH